MAPTEPTQTKQCFPCPIENDKLVNIITTAKDWAIMHGAGIRSKSHFSEDALNFAPFVLLPSALPRDNFCKAVELQPIINRLIHAVANDEDFLTEALSDLVDVDEFTGNLFYIFKKVAKDGIAQPISLGMLRNDMMLNVNSEDGKNDACDNSFQKCSWRQVEINTIASGFGHLGPASRAIQAFVLRELESPEKMANMPENHALPGLCLGIFKAWHIYGVPSAAIVFIIEDVTYNICDQRFHEFYMREQNPHIKILRRTLTEVHRDGSLGPKKELLLGTTEVAVVYYRAGYDPAHYPTQKEWNARLLIESSLAIKCPTIQYHLAGTKKVQQLLTQPGILETFLHNPKDVQNIRNTFAGLYTLTEGEKVNDAFKRAIAEPEKYVLKPQREGGCNNLFGDDIPAALETMSPKDLSAWILMDRINPPITKGYIVRPDGPIPPPMVDLVSELGIFGVIIGDANNIICNYQSGHMFRTKLSTANEGGVATGLGALDSPYLVD